MPSTGNPKVAPKSGLVNDNLLRVTRLSSSVRVKTKITEALAQDFDCRGVHTFVNRAGTYDLDAEQRRLLREDCEYQTDKWGPDELPPSLKRAYAALLRQVAA